MLDDAFAHHVWATLRLIDACLALPPEQLAASNARTYGSILNAMCHLVGFDASYRFVTTGGRTPRIGRTARAFGSSGRRWSGRARIGRG